MIMKLNNYAFRMTTLASLVAAITITGLEVEVIATMTPTKVMLKEKMQLNFPARLLMAILSMPRSVPI